MPTLKKFRAMMHMNKRGLRRTCTLDEIKTDVSFLYPPPNGGWGWVVVLAAATHCLFVSGFHSAFGVYMLPLLDTFKSSNSQIAWIGSVSYAFIMIFGPVSGKLLVKYGAIKVAIIGNLVTIGGLVWSSYSEKLSMLFFTHGIIVGVGSSLAYTPDRTHPSVVEKFKTSPLRGFIVDLGLWKDRIFEVWVSSLGLAKFGFFIPFVHMMKLAGDLGIPLEKASYIMVGLGVSSMISCLLFGKICDIENIDRLYINQASILSVGVVYFIIPHCTSFGTLVAICSLLGFFDAGNYVLLPVLTFDLMGAERMPVAWGFMMAVNAISCFGPPFAGAMYDIYGSYTTGFVVTGICNIAAAGILALIPWLQREAVQSTKNYINASVCVITNTIVPWQSPSPSLGSISSSFTKSMASPKQSTSGHSKGFSMKSFKSILKSEAASYKNVTPQVTSEQRPSVEYIRVLQEHEENTADGKQDSGKSELASLRSQTSVSMIQAEPIPCRKEDGVVFLNEYEGDEEEAGITTEVRPAQELTVPEQFVRRERSDSKQLERFPHRKEDGVAFLDEYEEEEEEAEITTEVRPAQELTVPEQFVRRERSDSKQMERFPHRKEDGVAFLDEYEEEEEEAEITTGVRPAQGLTVPELFVRRERSDSKQLEHIFHRKEDGVAFLDDFISGEEEHLKYMPSASHRKEDGTVFLEDIDDPNVYQEQLKSTAAPSPMEDVTKSEMASEENETSTSLKDSEHTSPQKEQ
ncbi:uncharacterized protein LOC120308145 isoform X2 [Crotalus tigris]|uniref:uncharacterized protein LOC120308145 isoform X2 n=1 Tax=Crotalus tigris TaxID=88082 RepID=UPI00192FA369|nr:uncharacterized protein LOC120308145 isoform X2 [Crotalus tigris]